MTAFFNLFFIADFFWCLRRSGFVIGARENGLGARPNFLYAGKTLVLGEGYKKLSQRFQLSVSTVRNVIKKWKATGTVLVKARSGRTRKISEAKDGQNGQILQFRPPPK